MEGTNAEACWSDYAYCKRIDDFYCCAKMMAEITTTEAAAARGLQLAMVVPCVTVPYESPAARDLPLHRRRAAPRPAHLQAQGPLPGVPCPRHCQVGRRQQANGEAVQVLQPEAQRPELGVHSAQEELARGRGVHAAEGPPPCYFFLHISFFAEGHGAISFFFLHTS